jgi:hypothetical protein
LRGGFVGRDNLYDRGGDWDVFGEFHVHGELHGIRHCRDWRVSYTPKPERESWLHCVVHGYAERRLHDGRNGWRHMRGGFVGRDNIHNRSGNGRVYGEFYVHH